MSEFLYLIKGDTMNFNNFVTNAQVYFPQLTIKYKTQSWLMQILGKILFFNPSFMTEYITSFGNTVYFPSEDFVNTKFASSIIILMHELVHISDSKKYSKFLFGLSYMFPQILSLLIIPMLFFFHWYIALIPLLFLLPFPAYFRMYFEKRAYLVSLYCIYALSGKLHYPAVLNVQEKFFVSQFTGDSYYFMWPFASVQGDFDDGAKLIGSGAKPFNDTIFTIIDDLISKV